MYDPMFSGRIVDSLQTIRGEFDGQLDLRLSVDDAEARWHLDAALSRLLLDALVEARFLRRTTGGIYRRRIDADAA